MFNISELTKRDIINLVDGTKLGPVKDVQIDLASGTVQALVLHGDRKYFKILGASQDVVIPWQKIKKIGKDAVLVEITTGVTLK